MKLKLISSITLVLIAIGACTDHFDEINTDPRLITSDLVNVDHMVTNVQVITFFNGISWGNAAYMDSYCGMVSRGDAREFAEGDYSGPWNSAYGSRLNNISDVIHLTKDDPDLVNKKAIARIIRAYIVSILTDHYGDVPYFEAALPQEDAVYSPHYDQQQEIYTDLFNELREAAAELDASKESYGSADLIYGGDVDLWRKFANSLRLRFALRVRYADPALAQSALSGLAEGDFITSRSEDAIMFTNDDQPDHRNSLFIGLESSPGEQNRTQNVGKTMLDILINNHSPLDPRIGIYADTAQATFPGTPGYEDVEFFGYRGRPLLGNSPQEYKYPYALESVSRFSRLWRVPIIERPVMRSSEVFFNLAEANLFGLINYGDANTYYQMGIDAAIEWTKEFFDNAEPQMPLVLSLNHPTWTEEQIQEHIDYKSIKESEIDAFKAAPVYNLSGNEEEQLEQIINQKLVALYPDGFQGWCNYRRTGYPRILIGPDTDHLRGQIPRRMPWPQREELLNSDNFKEVIERHEGSNSRLLRFWWDDNPNAPHPHPGEVETRQTSWF